MTNKSNTTKKYETLAFIFGALSLLVLISPVLVYTIQAFIMGEVVEKFVVGGLGIAALIAAGASLFLKLNLKCPIWLILIGIYFALDNIMPLLLLVAAGVILDELVLTPLHKNFKNKATINLEIDKRMNQ